MIESVLRLVVQDADPRRFMQNILKIWLTTRLDPYIMGSLYDSIFALGWRWQRTITQQETLEAWPKVWKSWRRVLMPLTHFIDRTHHRIVPPRWLYKQQLMLSTLFSPRGWKIVSPLFVLRFWLSPLILWFMAFMITGCIVEGAHQQLSMMGIQINDGWYAGVGIYMWFALVLGWKWIRHIFWRLLIIGLVLFLVGVSLVAFVHDIVYILQTKDTSV